MTIINDAHLKSNNENQFRGILILGVPNDVQLMDGWEDGPVQLPLPNGSVTDTAARSTYFDQRARNILYGVGNEWHRRYRLIGATISNTNFHVDCLEFLSTPLEYSNCSFLLIHLRSESLNTDVLLSEWRNISNRMSADLSAFLLETATTGMSSIATYVLQYKICFLHTYTPSANFAPFPSLLQYLLFRFASGTTDERFPIDSDQVNEFSERRFVHSRDWSSLTLRDGTSFVSHDPLSPSKYIEQDAEIYVRTIYTDPFLLGLVQAEWLNGIADEMANSEKVIHLRSRIGQIENRFSQFRNQVWWQHLTRHGTGNELLKFFHRERHLPELLEQIRSELSDYTRQTTSLHSRVIQTSTTTFAFISLLNFLTTTYLQIQLEHLSWRVLSWMSLSVIAPLITFLVVTSKRRSRR